MLQDIRQVSHQLTGLLCHSEFPSLSNTSQPQYQNASQAIWANQRAMQQSAVQRPQQQQQPPNALSPHVSQQHSQSQQPLEQTQRSNEDTYSSTSHLQSAMDDSRYQSALGQIPLSRQPQTTSVDDFPPLGRNGNGESDDRRGNIMQNSGFGSFSNPHSFSLPLEQMSGRNSISNPSAIQASTTRSATLGDRLASPNGNGFGRMSDGMLGSV